VAFGAQDVGQDEGVAQIALGRDGAEAGPAGLDQVGMDRRDDAAGSDQRVDQQAGGSLDRDRDFRRCSSPLQPREEGLEAAAIVADGKPVQDVQDLSVGNNHAHRMTVTAAVDADHHRHGLVSSSWVIITTAGSPGGVLIHRHSGWQPTALHLPVARRGLPAAVAPLVSWSPRKASGRDGHDSGAEPMLLQPTGRTSVR
jgi:hypothetical protein